MAISVEYNVRDNDGQLIGPFFINLQNLLDQFAEGNVDTTLAQAIGATLGPGQTLTGGMKLWDETGEQSSGIANATPLGTALAFNRWTGYEPRKRTGDLEQVTEGPRAVFGEFLTRSGLDPGAGFGRRQGERQFERFVDASALQDLLAATEIDPVTGEIIKPEGSFEAFLSNLDPSNARGALANVWQQAMGIPAMPDVAGMPSINPFDVAQQGGGSGSSRISDAATSLLRSQYNPIFGGNIDFRSSADLQSDYLQAQQASDPYLGNFTSFLQRRLGLDRFLDRSR